MKKRIEKTPTTFGIPDEKIALILIGIVHFSGACLLMFSKSGVYKITLDLVPITLALTLLISLKFHTDFNIGFFVFSILALSIGLVAEMIGTNLGWLFGNYSYGEVLGIKIWNTPLIIGVNWFLIVYGIGMLASRLKVNIFGKWIFSVAGLVFFDYFMEPVALKHGFWEWHEGTIPISNYLGWAFVAGILSVAFHFCKFDKNNFTAGKIWLIQFGFFAIQNVL